MSSKISFNSQLIIAGIIIATVLAVSLTETLQIADGFSASKTNMVFELDVGETQMLTWPVSNIGNETINVQFYATGEGSELLVFEEFVAIEPHVRTEFEIFVIVPEDHPDNVEYHPELFVLKRGDDLEEGATGMIVNVQYRTLPIIKIGDNPIYTLPVVEAVDEPKVEPEPEPKVEEEKEETLEEKLERIEAANRENAQDISPTEPENDQEPLAPEDTITSVSEPEMDPEPKTICGPGTELINRECQVIESEEPSGGGCLIATASYGSPMAKEVQMLREIRDNQLLQTQSGSAFMSGFNTVYYSFAPAIAQWEQENPAFKELVKTTITPLITSLSLLNHVSMDSEAEVLGYGISLILFNFGMYFAIPATVVWQIKKRI